MLVAYLEVMSCCSICQGATDVRYEKYQCSYTAALGHAARIYETRKKNQSKIFAVDITVLLKIQVFWETAPNRMLNGYRGSEKSQRLNVWSQEMTN
jgi:hypothetical protein